MENTIFKRSAEKSKRDKVLDEIKLVKIQLRNVFARFEQTSDRDLVESIIYETEALKARYRYLMRLAKVLEAAEK